MARKEKDLRGILLLSMIPMIPMKNNRPVTSSPTPDSSDACRRKAMDHLLQQNETLLQKLVAFQKELEETRVSAHEIQVASLSQKKEIAMEAENAFVARELFFYSLSCLDSAILHHYVQCGAAIFYVILNVLVLPNVIHVILLNTGYVVLTMILTKSDLRGYHDVRKHYQEAKARLTIP